MTAGGAASLGFLLLFGLAVLIFLFATVHRRDARAAVIEAPPLVRQTLMVWIEHGHFRHGGLRFLEPVDENPRQWVWRSNPMGFLVGAHLLERVYYVFTGRFSDRLHQHPKARTHVANRRERRTPHPGKLLDPGSFSRAGRQ